MKVAGIWIAIVGAAIIVGCVLGGVFMAVNGLRPMVMFSDSEIDVGDSGNTLEHYFDAGQEMQLYTNGANGVYVGTIPNCDIDGPAPVKHGASTRSSVTIGARSRISFQSVVFPESGTYAITCDQSGVTVAPPASAVGLMSGIGGIFLTFFGGALGFVVLIVGIVLWVLGARKRAHMRRAEAAAKAQATRSANLQG
ncbi:MAG: hypothetical protein ACK5LO_10455 [Leucobacter sp.]